MRSVNIEETERVRQLDQLPGSSGVIFSFGEQLGFRKVFGIDECRQSHDCLVTMLGYDELVLAVGNLHRAQMLQEIGRDLLKADSTQGGIHETLYVHIKKERSIDLATVLVLEDAGAGKTCAEASAFCVASEGAEACAEPVAFFFSD